jgi:hypothetical protein
VFHLPDFPIGVVLPEQPDEYVLFLIHVVEIEADKLGC